MARDRGRQRWKGTLIPHEPASRLLDGFPAFMQGQRAIAETYRWAHKHTHAEED